MPIPSSRYLVVEFDAAVMPLASFTARHPGTAIDFVAEPAQRVGAEVFHGSVFLARGMTEPLRRELLDEAEAAYDHVETIRIDPLSRTWMAALRIKETADWPPIAKAVAAFQGRFGIPWVHVADGIVYLRAMLREPERGDELVAEMLADLAERGLEAQVDVQEMSAGEFGVWQEIVDASRRAR